MYKSHNIKEAIVLLTNAYNRGMILDICNNVILSYQQYTLNCRARKLNRFRRLGKTEVDDITLDWIPTLKVMNAVLNNMLFVYSNVDNKFTVADFVKRSKVEFYLTDVGYKRFVELVLEENTEEENEFVNKLFVWAYNYVYK